MVAEQHPIRSGNSRLASGRTTRKRCPCQRSVDQRHVRFGAVRSCDVSKHVTARIRSPWIKSRQEVELVETCVDE